MEQHQNQPQQPAQPAQPKKKASKSKKVWLIVGIVVLLVLFGSVAVYYSKTIKVKKEEISTTQIEDANKAFINNDKDKALEHAKKALAEQPNNYDVVITVASLSNPEEAKQYYAKAFEIFKNETNLDAKQQPTQVYWTAANLTERAGQKDLTIKYYELVIKTANLSNEYEKQLAKESEAALKRLR